MDWMGGLDDDGDGDDGETNVKNSGYCDYGDDDLDYFDLNVPLVNRKRDLSWKIHETVPVGLWKRRNNHLQMDHGDVCDVAHGDFDDDDDVFDHLKQWIKRNKKNKTS